MAIVPFSTYAPPGIYGGYLKFTSRGKIHEAYNIYVMDSISAEELWDIVNRLADKAHIEDVLDI